MRHETSPAGLVRCTKTLAGIAIEVLIEGDVRTPQRIVSRPDAPTVSRAATVRSPAEQRDQAIVDRVGGLRGSEQCRRSRGNLDARGVTNKRIVGAKRVCQQDVHWEPDGSSPVGIATKDVAP